MPKIRYVDRAFSARTMETIEHCNGIIADYAAQGYDLTLRQLYYQFVSRALIPNSDAEYKKLGSVINDARLAGLIDWSAIMDRTRNLRALSHWDTPKDIISSAAYGFRIDKWLRQPFRVEVWIEKDALVGVLTRVCNELDVPYFSCRGYTSQSDMWSAAMRLQRYAASGQRPLILHLGDHDPSGKDMTRDISDRLALFMGGTELWRLALNMDQVETYDPPPNPAKTSDARASAYIAEFGESSWELDALEPAVITELIRNAVYSVRDSELWQEATEAEERHIRQLKGAAQRWDEVAALIDGKAAPA